MVRDTGSLSGKTADSIDLSSPAVLMSVLRIVREDPALSLGDRNHLRDQILTYRTSGNDPGLKIAIQAQLSSLGITAENLQSKNNTNNKTPKIESGPGFRRGRQAPVFVSAAVAVKTTTSPVVAERKLDKPVSESVSQIPEVKSESVEVDSPIRKIEPQIPQTTKPDSVTIAVSTPAREIKIPPQNNAAAEVVSQDSFDTTPYVDRIRVIKTDINSKVGNPVHLVEKDQIVGRQYMNALLEAMKLLSAGNETSLKTAMEALEGAYQKALQVLDATPMVETQDTPVVSAPTQLEEQVAQPAPPVVPVVESTIVTPIAPEPPIAIAPVTPAASTAALAESVPESPVHVSAPTIAPSPAPAISHNIPTMRDHSESLSPVSVPIQSSRRIAPISSVSAVTPLHAPNAVIDPAAVTASVVPPPAPAVRIPSPVSPVASAPALKSINDLPSPHQTDKTGTNPLHSEAVTAGLDQLLSEWVLFKKSGMFGTGPKGRQHPLFIQLANLPIPQILAGKFEGANPTIRQSITDYMNGWRYEQGIVYEKDETFELYLRRVIHHILEHN